MADFIVRNSLNPYKAVKFSITLQQQVLKDGKGGPIWVAEINTLEPSISGTQFKSKYLHLRTLTNLDDEIEKITSELCDQIDWTPLLEDNREPYVDSYIPFCGSEVDIDSSVELVLKESMPSVGIDKNSISVVLDGIDITNEVDISGNPYEYILKWKPSTIIYESH